MNHDRYNDTWQRIRKQPVRFVLRQIYRLLIVYPWVWLVAVAHNLRRSFAKANLSQPIEHCFIITSIIAPATQKLVSHGSPRTVFNPAERAEQTMETIRSIRARAPQAKIVLIEGGLEYDTNTTLASFVDEYVYVGKTSIVRWACDSTNKSMGEAVMLIAAQARMATRARYYFKISGRYVLNDQFNLAEWNRAGFTFLKIKSMYVSTRLYGFSATMLPVWVRALWQGVALHLIDYPIEYTLSRYISSRNISFLSVIGVSGVGGSSTREVIRE